MTPNRGISTGIDSLWSLAYHSKQYKARDVSATRYNFQRIKLLWSSHAGTLLQMIRKTLHLGTVLSHLPKEVVIGAAVVASNCIYSVTYRIPQQVGDPDAKCFSNVDTIETSKLQERNPLGCVNQIIAKILALIRYEGRGFPHDHWWILEQLGHEAIYKIDYPIEDNVVIMRKLERLGWYPNDSYNVGQIS